MAEGEWAVSKGGVYLFEYLSSHVPLNMKLFVTPYVGGRMGGI